MAHIAIHVNLHIRIRDVRPSTCNIVRNAFGHLIRAPHYFQNSWIDRIHIWSDDRYGSRDFLSTIPIPPPTPTYDGLKVKVTDLEVYS